MGGSVNRPPRCPPRPPVVVEKALDVVEKIATLTVVFAMVPLILYSAHRYNKIKHRSSDEKYSRK